MTRSPWSRAMRVAVCLLTLSIVLAGCTSDGDLGGIDEGGQREQAEARAASLWESASASHRGDVRLSGSRMKMTGDLAPLELSTIPLQLAPSSPSPPPGNARPTHFALAGAIHDGVRGWLVLNTSGTPALDADPNDPIVVRDHALRAEGASLSARIAGTGLLWTEHAPLGCFEDLARPDDPAACRAWRDARPPAKPAVLANSSQARFPGLELPGNLTVRALGLEFIGPDGASRPLGPAARVATHNATLAAFVVDAGGLLLELAIEVPVAKLDRLDWRGNLTVHATPPSGEVGLRNATPFALYNDATIKLRGNGPSTLALREPGPEWELTHDDAELVSVLTGATPRLQAALALAPNVVDVVGPAGNATRVKLILAETSGGADAHLTGYRIDPSVQARYVGAEPFAMTRELLALMNETGAGAITAPMLIGLGVALPFVAILEGVAGFFQAIFPPSLAGTLGAGEAETLTFELLMPDAPRDVEILIESANADPARATVRMQPAK